MMLMENAADALKMAGAVLIFVLALSLSITSFSQARQASDTILNFRDRETQYINGDFYYETTGTERTVGLETIIPSIYRVYREDYRIVFVGLTEPLYQYKNPNNPQDVEDRYVLNSDDTSKEPRPSQDANQNNRTFLEAILYGKTDTNFNNWYGNVIRLPQTSLYNQLKSAKEIKEYLGVYTTTQNADVPESMKTKKRIITYEVIY